MNTLATALVWIASLYLAYNLGAAKQVMQMLDGRALLNANQDGAIDMAAPSARPSSIHGSARATNELGISDQEAPLRLVPGEVGE